MRIALVPWGQHVNEKTDTIAKKNFERNVMKFTCFGHDARPEKYHNGECLHPCNARPGCQYQSSKCVISN